MPDNKRKHPSTLKFALVATALLAALTLTACGSSSSSASRTATAATSGTITIHNFSFGRAITVKAGATVTVKNTDSTAHTVTADNKSFDTGPIQPGKSATFTVAGTGTITFHCNIHNYMTGTIHVMS